MIRSFVLFWGRVFRLHQVWRLDVTHAHSPQGYERVRGLASEPEVLPPVRRIGRHVIVDLGGELRSDFVPSTQSRAREGA